MASIQLCLLTLLLSAMASAAARLGSTEEPPFTLNEDTPLVNPFPDMPDEHLKMLEGEFEITNPEEVNGQELFESDILLTPEQRQMLLERKATAYLSTRWTNGPDGYPLVPYIFGDTSVDQAAVNAGIQHWMDVTCINFELTNASATNPHLRFIKDSGCWSYVGMVFPTSQDISIGSGCTGLGTVVHEIGHAIGFNHEQSRIDRDAYVVINSANIIPGKEGNFEKRNTNNYSVPYDFVSDLHYGSRYFTVNGLVTIATRNPLAQALIGRRGELSHYDKLLANTMYPCISKWMENCGEETNPCQNDGYVGEDCDCVCRPGTDGDNCENVVMDYYDSQITSCSKIITEEGTVTSPGYPAVSPQRSSCVTWIQAPECHTATVTFTVFDLYHKNNYCNGNLCCYFDFLEIRTDNLFEGPVFCDSEIIPGQSFTSTSNEIILYFVTRAYDAIWSANVTFNAVPGCAATGTSTTTTTTSTTTSTPTTSTTSTTTSTTSTTTSTSTTTTSSSTTAVPIPDCVEDVISDSLSHWTSPNFGVADYPDNFLCSLTKTSNKPHWASITFNSFDLQAPTSSGHCLDEVIFTTPHDFAEPEYCGQQTGTVKLPSYNFNALFESDATITAAGFNISISRKTSNCHKLIEPSTIGDTGIIKPPKKANKIWEKKACEWWIKSPPGTKIQLKFLKMKLTANCKKSSVIVNMAGDNQYPIGSSGRYCGTTKPATAVSDDNEVAVLFFTKNNKKSFRARWTVVAA